MNLHSPYPYWLLRHGIINTYPSLSRNIKTDIAVIGAGISGALVASQLCQEGYDVAVFDRRHAGTGSTAASTALLQYEIDTPLHKLIGFCGKAKAVRSYQLCGQAIGNIKKICHQLNDPSLFTLKPSFQYASSKKDLSLLQEEFKLRKEAGFEMEWLSEKDILKKFHFTKPGGILSRDGAEADAYKITHSLLQKNIARGLRVYDNTEITDIHHKKRHVELVTAEMNKVIAKKLIIACGYESQQYIPQKVQDLHATFAAASEPFQEKNFWYRDALIWETAVPYLYLRTTADKRILIGGKDIPFSNPNKRDSLINQKTKSLERSFSRLFPKLPFKTDFKWAGTFASTRDGLPYIGSIRQRPNTYFALGFGGNGITFSAIAATIISNLLRGKKDDDAGIFQFDR